MTAERFTLLWGLFAAACASYLLAPHWISLAALLLISCLILKQCRQALTYLLIPLCLLSGLYFDHVQSGLRLIERQPERELTFGGQLMPDQFKIDGQAFSAILKLKDGRKVRLYWRIPSQAIQKRLLKESSVLKVEGSGKIGPIAGPTNFAQFDAKAYYRSQGIVQQIQAEQLDFQEDSVRFGQIEKTLRQWHAELIHAAQKLPKPLSYYSQALILGDNAEELYDDNPGIQVLGLIHLFSVSGFQVNLLTAIVLALTKRLGFLREVSLLILILLLPLYFLFSASPPILMRAIIAGELGLFKKLRRKRWSPVTIWSIALLVSLFYCPGILLTLGGQLSFILTFALLFSRQLSSWQRNLSLGMISLPLIVSQQYQWHLLQTLANFVAIPLFEGWIAPLVLLGFIGQKIAGIADCSNFLLNIFARSIDLTANLPGNFVIGRLSPTVLLILLALAFVTMSKKRIRRRIAGLVFLLVIIGSYYFNHHPGKGEYTTFDIGQGDAALLCPANRKGITLIDTGGEVTFQQAAWQVRHQQKSRAETVIVPYLYSRGIDHLDFLVLTHQDQDHLGNAGKVLGKIPVKYVLIPAGMKSRPAFKQKIQPYLRKAEVVEVTDKVKLRDFPGQILHPFQAGKGESEDSIAISAAIGPHKLFTAGDLDRSGERAILAAYPNLRADILKAGHHGSKTATDPELLKQLKVREALISAGRNNRYHHPHEETIANLQAAGVKIISTQNHGMLRYIYSGRQSDFEVKILDEASTVK
ncbi:DNA internalization-related competence protein ComEC/Rec2 [Eupransor demetentiae]|uniref:Metallo-beta-lactamase superfamily (ComEC) n=1 Tax=Eupransor demetentiae TaxID=3109584 RepID=A0ABP0ERK6_9LACO|nr:DNA uptake channel protein ComEC C-terminal domain [Lactobacillaceae bacterium LMG 33000]